MATHVYPCRQPVAGPETGPAILSPPSATIITKPSNILALSFSLIIVLLFIPQIGFADREVIRQANHPSTTPTELQQLSQHSDKDVRHAVAMNRRAASVTLKELASDDHIDVRIAVATNLSTTEEIFFILANDQSEQVRSVVARFEYVSADVLAKLADDPSPDIRYEVAKNWNTDNQTLQKLTGDNFTEVSMRATQTLEERQSN